MTDTEEWPEPALSLLDSLWALDTHMAVIRRRLEPVLGWCPEPAAVRDMARRYRAPAKPPPPPKAMPVKAAAPTITAPPVVEFRFVPPPKADNPVRRVPPGTYPTRGFSMLGGRTKGRTS